MIFINDKLYELSVKKHKIYDGYIDVIYRYDSTKSTNFKDKKLNLTVI